MTYANKQVFPAKSKNFESRAKTSRISNNLFELNYLDNNIKDIYIMCLDDDQMFLGMLAKNLRNLAGEYKNLRFNFIFTNCCQDFFREFINLITKNIVVDFFVMDQNISQNMKGIDCYKIVNKFYNLYFKDSYARLNFKFFFVSGEANITDFKIM